MNRRLTGHNAIFNILLIAALSLLMACNSTKHLGEHQYLVVKNKVNLRSEHKIPNKSEFRDVLNKSILQKPNTNSFDILPFRTPMRLWKYNRKYAKFHNRPDTSLPRSVERPVILDTALLQLTVQRMKNYLFNQGYFYAKVKDTFIITRHKAFVTYNIQTGINYQINNVSYYIDDSNIARIIRAKQDATVLEKGKYFSYNLTADERSRIVVDVRNAGYYKFNLDNITFVLDTVDKAAFKNIESPFKSAVDFVSPANEHKKPTLDIAMYIHLNDDTLGFKKYRVNSVHIYPDYRNIADLKDSTLLKRSIDSIEFRYHNDYVHPKVLYQHTYVRPGSFYSQDDYDKTQAKLTELGIFQLVRIVPNESRKNRGTLDYDILLVRAKKYDFSTLYELSSGTTYSLGHSVGISLRDKNFMKGANLLSIGLNGGIELNYDANKGDNVITHLVRQTTYYGANASIDFPKFLAPIASSLFDNSNLPHTIIGGGTNLIDRLDYYTLINTSANFSYSWRETQTKTWTLAPAFINIITLPQETDSFKKALANNAYLRNSYKENFIEGENIAFVVDNAVKKHNINYSYLKLGLEEAGALLSLASKLAGVVNDAYTIKYAQYVKFDFDARHYFTLRHTAFAFRFSGGIGAPYGVSTTLPYIKQYFSGGPYSLRGWRIRTLGPGSFFDSSTINSQNQIDRTADIKLELNGEFRFPITMLFAGAVKMNGALFADAGNIWLAKKDTSFKGGEFSFNTLGQDIAADIGLGTRFDIASFLTLRIDVAMPVKKPYILTNNGWVFDSINFNDPTWRSNNVILNVSIGYPF
jgi:outer membrane protein insertion porin family